MTALRSSHNDDHDLIDLNPDTERKLGQPLQLVRVGQRLVADLGQPAELIIIQGPAGSPEVIGQLLRGTGDAASGLHAITPTPSFRQTGSSSNPAPASSRLYSGCRLTNGSQP